MRRTRFGAVGAKFRSKRLDATGRLGLRVRARLVALLVQHTEAVLAHHSLNKFLAGGKATILQFLRDARTP